MVHTPVTSVLSYPHPLGVCLPPSRTGTPLDVPLHASLLAGPAHQWRHACAEYFYAVESLSMDFDRFDVSFEFVN